MPRYETMRGRASSVDRVGIVTGLPAETEAQRELGVGAVLYDRVASNVSTQHCKTSVLCYTRGLQRASVTRRGLVGGSSRTIRRRWTPPTWRASIWAFKNALRRGLTLPGPASSRTAGNARRRSRTSRRARTTPTGSRRPRRSPTRSRSTQSPTAWVRPRARCARARGRRRRGRRLRPALAVGPSDHLRDLRERGRRALPRRRVRGRGLRGGARRRGSRRHRRRRSSRRADLSARSSTTSRARRTPSACSPGISSRPKTGRGSCTWPPASVRTTSDSASRLASPSSAPSTIRA